ncbi:MAG TPA: phage portal protein [Phycisphaerae bacterium]|nr:phage portal protein [Phycisphaerae bacterium]
MSARPRPGAVRRSLRAIPRFIDSLISVPFPGWGSGRARARLRMELAVQRRGSLVALSTYEAAERNRNLADFDPRNKSADQAIVKDYSYLLARARAVVRDDWCAASIVDGWVRHIVGTGVWPRANAADPDTDQPYTDFNAWADWWFARWARDPRSCDVEERKSLLEILSLVAREYIVTGQSFVVLSYEPDPAMVGLKLQVVEPEQLDTTMQRNSETGNEVRRGIEVDERGRAVAYWVHTGPHPMENFGRRAERIPAERVLHFLRQDRPRQTHGVSRLAPILLKLWHTKMYDEYTLLRARFEACGGATIETDGAQPEDLMGTVGPTDDPTLYDEDALGNQQLQFEPNLLWNLPPGSKAVFHDPKVPGGMYEPFKHRQIAEAAAGAGLDYPTVSRDFSGNTFSGQRQGMLELWAETDPEVQHLINQVVRPIWELFQTLAIAEARYAAPGFELSDVMRAAYLEALYQPPPKEWIDPANQAAAAKIEIDYRLKTRQEVIGPRGGDVRDTMRGIAEERRLAEAEGVTLPENQSEAPPVAPQEPRPRGVARLPVPDTVPPDTWPPAEEDD